MKNINISLLLIFPILILSLSGISQPLTLSLDGETIGDSLLIVGLTTDNELVAHAVVTNNTSSSMDIKVRRTQLEIVEGSINYFCWGDNCYPPSVNESPAFLTLAAGASTDELDFSGHYEPRNNFGDSFIEYKFFNMNNEDENVKVVVQFAATNVGINEHDLSVNVYPNPASDQVNISLGLMINEVLVYDYTGKMISRVQVDSKTYQMNVSHFNPGVYLFKVMADEGIVVKQVIIK